MKFNEILTESAEDVIVEAKIVWARAGKSITRKYRCVFGKRAGRIVADPAQCTKPIDIKKRFALKKLKAKMGARMARKAKRTKRLNPASKRVAALNKASKR